MNYLRKILAIVRKDIVAELRTKEMFSAMFVFAVLVIVVFNFAFDLRVSGERVRQVAPDALWVAFAFSGVLGLNRAFVLEKGIKLHNEKYLHQGWDMVKGNLSRIKSMALDLLSFTKDREPDYQLHDPNRLAQEVADLIRPRAREHGVSFKLKLAEGLPNVWLDAEGIHRCLLNLLANAIDACIDVECARRQGKVILQTSRPQGWAVEYQVDDNGCGMDEETQGKIFQRFFSKKGSRGTGLGLMLTKKIVDEHEGHIQFKSEPGKGTKFIIKLPEKDQPREINEK